MFVKKIYSFGSDGKVGRILIFFSASHTRALQRREPLAAFFKVYRLWISSNRSHFIPVRFCISTPSEESRLPIK